MKEKYNRREFLGLTVGLALAGCGKSKELEEKVASDNNLPQIDEFIIQKMESDHLPGVAACIVKNGELFWSKGYGRADIERNIPMTPDSIQNVASISKTITTTAIMQLWEKGRFQLDDDINKYLSFSVHNPFNPNIPITFKHLLTHTSSIKDGSAYVESYSRGDPDISLKNWIKEYLTPNGTYYNKEENYFNLKPGEKWNYSNVSFGLLGVLIEEISNKSFADFCKEHIFLPLDMQESAWYLSELDISKHVVPYAYVEEGQYFPFLMRDEINKGKSSKEGFFPHCLYSFPNLPDGLLRTSVNQISHFLIAYINNGSYNNKRILKESTVKNILSPQINKSELPKWLNNQGFSWFEVIRLDNSKSVWEHSGDDPGVSTIMSFCPYDGNGTIVFTNTSTNSVVDISKRLYKEATTT